MDHTEFPSLEEYMEVYHHDPNDTIKHLLEFLNEFQKLIERGEISEDSVEFVEYLDQYCTRDATDGQTITSHEINYLFESNPADSGLSPRSSGISPGDYGIPSVDDLCSDKQFYIVYMRLRLSLGGEDFETLQSEIQNHIDKYNDRSPFQLIKSDVYRQGYYQHHFQEALSSAHNAVNACDRNARYLHAFVDSTIKVIYGLREPELDIDDLPSSRSDLLDCAKTYLLKLQREAPNISSVYVSRSRLLELENRFDDAEQALNQALGIVDSEDSKQINTIRSRRDSLRQNRENANRAEMALSNVRSEIEDLQNQSETIEQKLRGDMENYRNQMLQFIVFFTGILAVIIMSIQVTLELQSVQDAIYVIVVLTGSIIFAFSTLSVTIFNDSGNGVIGIIIGSTLILFGYISRYIYNILEMLYNSL